MFPFNCLTWNVCKLCSNGYIGSLNFANLDVCGHSLYFLFPRLAAVAENGWSAVERKNWDDFVDRMLRQLDRYDLWGIRYSERFLETEDINRKK